MSWRGRIVGWLPAVAWMALIFALSAISGLRFSADSDVDGPLRNMAHVGIYAILALLFVFAMPNVRWPAVGIVAVALAVLYGVTDELHQSMVADRNGNVLDLVLDGIGAIIGVVVAWSWPRIHERLRTG